MSRILAIDPGTAQSGVVQTEDGVITLACVMFNETLLERVRVTGAYVANGLVAPMVFAIERFEARGMPIGEDSIETVIWTGRFMQDWHTPDDVVLIRRSAIKVGLCGTSKAKDANIRQALIDRLGPPGSKKSPGPTFGVTSHAWAALAVAVTAQGTA